MDVSLEVVPIDAESSTSQSCLSPMEVTFSEVGPVEVENDQGPSLPEAAGYQEYDTTPSDDPDCVSSELAVSSQTNPSVLPVTNNDPPMPVADVSEQVCYP
ncbi:PREDICTED: uncharacterized protein LOC107354561 [Acropora digitifera]|uniref:uncharacterized protein LOC107354561 n=1 Tax=Acropora digitifera TaxID=70779 RepID=UPI00077A5918|nr:PREDICTED: uncharacterized protein LOC107354561 [Acropora digitifera]